jgi:hypothetical protein
LLEERSREPADHVVPEVGREVSDPESPGGRRGAWRERRADSPLDVRRHGAGKRETLVRRAVKGRARKHQRALGREVLRPLGDEIAQRRDEPLPPAPIAFAQARINLREVNGLRRIAAARRVPRRSPSGCHGFGHRPSLRPSTPRPLRRIVQGQRVPWRDRRARRDAGARAPDCASSTRALERTAPARAPILQGCSASRPGPDRPRLPSGCWSKPRPAVPCGSGRGRD